MAISFVGSNSSAGVGVTTLAVTAPGGIQAGDLIVAYSTAWMSTGSTLSLPTGFTSAASGGGFQNTANHLYNLGTKVATGSEPASYSFSYSTSTWPIAFIYILRGVDQNNPIANLYSLTNAPAYTTTMPAASGTIASSSDGTVYIYAGINSAATGLLTVTMPGGLSNSASQGNASLGGIVGIGWGTNITSPGSATTTSPVDYTDFLIDFRPAPATYRDKSAIVTGGNTALATLNVTIPGTIQNNDLGFLCLAWVVPGTEETPTVSGWTALYGSYQAEGTLRWLVFYRQYQTGDSATVTVTFASGIGKLINAQAYWWSNAGSAPAVLGATGTRAGSGGTTTTTAPSLTTTAPDQTVVVMGFERTTVTETDITSISLGTERGFVPDSGSTICTIVVADFVQLAQGATPAVNIVYPNTQALNGDAIQIAIPNFPLAVGPTATIAWLTA